MSVKVSYLPECTECSVYPPVPGRHVNDVSWPNRELLCANFVPVHWELLCADFVPVHWVLVPTRKHVHVCSHYLDACVSDVCERIIPARMCRMLGVSSGAGTPCEWLVIAVAPQFRVRQSGSIGYAILLPTLLVSRSLVVSRPVARFVVKFEVFGNAATAARGADVDATTPLGVSPCCK